MPGPSATLLRIVVLLPLMASALRSGELPLSFQKVRDRAFPVLALLLRDPAASGAVRADPELRAVAAAAPAKPSGFALEPYRLTADQIASARRSLMTLYRKNAGVRRWVDGPLRKSGDYPRYASAPGDALLGAAWEDAARAIDRIIDVYGKGARPRYPEIDSVSYDPKSDLYRRLLTVVATALQENRRSSELFFEPPLECALELLWVNGRDEAGRLEPLDQGGNAAALRRLPSIDWNAYPYSAILVPGAASRLPTQSMSPWAKLRVALAVKRYREKEAPLLIVSGGYVHPAQTPYCEALEMKRCLVAEFGVAENAILIDPYARHTTTNLRNAVRELIRYGVPADKRVLVVSDPGQTAMIASPSFDRRCRTELGYLPYRSLKLLSPCDLSFLANPDSLQVDALDPLDP